jgi:hypothetical protein
MAKIYLQMSDGTWKDVCDCQGQLPSDGTWIDPSTQDFYVQKADGTWEKADCEVPCGAGIEISGGGAGTTTRRFQLGDLSAFSGAYIVIQYDGANVPDNFVFTATDLNDPSKTITVDLGYRGDSINGIGSGGCDPRDKVEGFGYGTYQFFLPPIGWTNTVLDVEVTGDCDNTGWFLFVDCPVPTTVNRFATVFFNKKFPLTENQDEWFLDGIGYEIELSVLDGNGDNIWEQINPSRTIVGDSFFVPQYARESDIPALTSGTGYYKGYLVRYNGDVYYYNGTVQNNTSAGNPDTSPNNWNMAPYSINPLSITTGSTIEFSNYTTFPNNSDGSGIKIKAGQRLKIRCRMTGASPDLPPGNPQMEVYDLVGSTSLFTHRFDEDVNSNPIVYPSTTWSEFTFPFSFTTNQELELRFDYRFA